MSLAKKQFDDLYFGRTENENEIKYTRVVKTDIIFDKKTKAYTIYKYYVDGNVYRPFEIGLYEDDQLLYQALRKQVEEL